jgi:hypothetical protein
MGLVPYKQSHDAPETKAYEALKGLGVYNGPAVVVWCYKNIEKVLGDPEILPIVVENNMVDTQLLAEAVAKRAMPPNGK